MTNNNNLLEIVGLIKALPAHLQSDILYKNKGIASPTAEIMQNYISQFEWMNGEFKTVDERNAEEPSDKQSYFISNSFYNYGFN